VIPIIPRINPTPKPVDLGYISTLAGALKRAIGEHLLDEAEYDMAWVKYCGAQIEKLQAESKAWLQREKVIWGQMASIREIMQEVWAQIMAAEKKMGG
jgi:uncharacterized protein (DUF3820 family)